MKIKIFLISIILIALSVFLFTTWNREKDIVKDRDEVLSDLYLAIEESERAGNYECCIEPPCTMCYLGDWKWKDGSCKCDEMIVKGDWDSVCPQCIKGRKEGTCNSKVGTCPL